MVSQPNHPTYVSGRKGDVFPSDLKIIFQAFSDSLFYLDQDGVIVGYLADESPDGSVASKAFLGKKLVDTLPKNVADLFAEIIAKTSSTSEVTTLEYELETRGASQWYVAKCVLQASSRLTIVIRNITEQKKAEAVARRQLALMTALNESAQRLSKELDSAVLGEDITRSCVEQFGVNQAWLGSLRGSQIIQPLAHWPMDYKPSGVDASVELPPDKLHYLLQKKTQLIMHPEMPDSEIQPVKALFPLISHNRVIGILGLLSDDCDFFTPETIDFFHAYCLIAASALENARLFADSNYQLIQIQTLRSIDQAILSDIDLHTTTRVILKEAAKHIHADAVALLALDQKTKLLNFVSGYGFRFDTFQHTHLPLGEGFAGQVVLKKQAIDIRNLREYPQAFSRATNFEREGFVTYLGTPLIARGEIKGVLEIFQRRPYDPSAEWFNILETLSNQIAIAIDNALLVEGLKTSNAELNAAYNATIEGLSRALELRDRETQGHTLRVTAMALQLARRIGGFSESELMHIHRGALLHDIGKMGIPDSILLKPGELTSEERKIMQQHPVYANDILFQIEHLQPALDIPRYHHEKWDGRGYPGKLKGEQIPMAARIFSIVDVFDALTSDRPYRKAWPRKKALEYIRAQSGIHFEPAIVEAFMSMMDEEPFPGPSTDANKPRKPRQSFDRSNNLPAAFFNLTIEPFTPSSRLFSDTKPIHYS